VHLVRGRTFVTRPSNQSNVQNWHKQVAFGTKKFLHSANLQAAILAAGFLRVPPKSSFKKLLLGTGLWHHAKMSTSLKSPDGLKDAECKKGQLSHWPPILYVLVVDIVTPKEESQVFKIKLPDASHLSMPIYFRGNNEEYLAHIVAVLRVIEQKELPKKCQVLAKADVRRSKVLKNLQEAAVLGSQANLKESSKSKELAEMRLQVLVVVITSDACESKKEIMRLRE
jgi:hypothetical protein